jgi:hypothetical protein
MCVAPELIFLWDKLKWIDRMSVKGWEDEEGEKEWEEGKSYLIGI